jgi:ribosomal protein S18 acetylase RimI-like enzyme
MSLVLREKRASDNERLAKVWTANYGGVTVVSRGHEQRPLELPGYIAIEDSEVVGAVTWNQVGDQFEIVTLDAFHDDRGIGTALLEAAIGFGRKCGAKRAWLITSNDNIRALRFYQRRGWDMVALYRNAVDESRKLKPEIPQRGGHDIPVRHEIEFELLL